MSQFARVREALNGSAWFIHEPKMRQILAALELRMNGGRADAEILDRLRAENETRAARAQNVSSASSGAVALIPIYGVICHRADLFADISGAVSTEKLTQQIRQAASDPNVRAIVFDIDSPGGSTDGVDELATEIYNARKQKSITAVSNSLCASAAYYLGAQASEFVVSPSSLTGSIGVYVCHEDYSQAAEKAGVKFTFIKFGENKVEANDVEPLSDTAREHLQEMVDAFGAMFEKAVARGRGVKAADVHDRFGQGRVFTAQKAVKIGMADRIATLDDVLGKYGVKRGSTTGSAASAFLVNPAALDSAAAESRTYSRSEIFVPRADMPVPDDDQGRADGDHDECSCPCEACDGGDCSGCDCSGCDSEGCDAADCNCDQDAEAKAAAARSRAIALLEVA